jgi:hypothetical protein
VGYVISKRHLIVYAGLLFLSLGLLACSSLSGGEEDDNNSSKNSSEGAYGIDYEHPELYLAAGPQSEVSVAYFAEVAEDLKIEQVDLSTIGKLYSWKTSRFVHVSAGGRYVGRRSVHEILEERTLTGCHDHGLLLVSLLRNYGVPAIMVDATGIDWALRYPDEVTHFSGHVFVEAFLGGQWILFDSTSGAYITDYDPINPVIPLTTPGEPRGYYVMYKGLDPADYGITGIQQLNAAQVRYAQMLKELSNLEFPGVPGTQY